MCPIDIDSLSEAELIELNHKVVARLRFLSQMRSHSAMLDFRVGERVKFHPDGQPELVGILTRYNKKTVTVVTDAGPALERGSKLAHQSGIRLRAQGRAG